MKNFEVIVYFPVFVLWTENLFLDHLYRSICQHLTSQNYQTIVVGHFHSTHCCLFFLVGEYKKANVRCPHLDKLIYETPFHINQEIWKCIALKITGIKNKTNGNSFHSLICVF